MPEPPFQNLSALFFIATVAVISARKLRFSSIPLVILLGVLFGPHAPHGDWFDLRLVENTESVAVLSRLGMLLLLFYLGLEFSAGQVLKRGVTILKGGTLYVALNFLRGLGLGWFFFHAWPETLVVAGITTVSSSAIVTKLMVELKRTANPETELILGTMVFEDAFMAVYLSVLSGYFTVQGTSLPTASAAGLTTILFICSLLWLGRFVSPFFDRWLNFRSGEPLIMVAFTLLTTLALLAERVGVTEAVSALLLGLILAETSQGKRLIQMVTPLRDLFGTVFFFSFGMGIDYRQFAPVASLALTAVAVTVLTNFITGLLSAWTCGYRGRPAVNVAASLMARGEFAVIAAGLGGAAASAGILQPFAALYILVLAVISPAIAKRSRSIHFGLERIRRLLSRDKPQSLAG